MDGIKVVVVFPSIVSILCCSYIFVPALKSIQRPFKVDGTLGRYAETMRCLVVPVLNTIHTHRPRPVSSLPISISYPVVRPKVAITVPPSWLLVLLWILWAAVHLVCSPRPTISSNRCSSGTWYQSVCVSHPAMRSAFYLLRCSSRDLIFCRTVESVKTCKLL